MARLRDISPAIRKVGLWTLAKRIWQQVGEDSIMVWASAVAYSWLFAVFPFLIFLLSLVPLVPERFKPSIENDIAVFLDEFMSQEVGGPIMDRVREFMNNRSGTILGFGLVLTVYAASKGMGMTMRAVDKAYDIEKGRPFWKQQPLALILTIVVATLVIAVMLLLPVGTAVVHWLKDQGTLFSWALYLVNVLRYSIALLLMLTVLAIVYHFGPSFKQPLNMITPGAVFCIAVWFLLGFSFKLYLTKLGGAESYAKTYGAVAGAAILLLFFYLDALVLLIGAEINSEIDFALGRAAHRK
jgi:membrane protein